MAFSGNFLCTSFKIELLKGTHDFTAASNKYKLAMFTNSAVPSDMGGSGSSMNASVVNYATNNEVSGTGYSAGGNFLTSITPSNPASGTTATTSFSNLVFPTVTITNARGAVIYNTTASNKAVCVLDFGADKAATAGDFTIVFPTNNASNAIIRIA